MRFLFFDHWKNSEISHLGSQLRKFPSDQVNEEDQYAILSLLMSHVKCCLSFLLLFMTCDWPRSSSPVPLAILLVHLYFQQLFPLYLLCWYVLHRGWQSLCFWSLSFHCFVYRFQSTPTTLFMTVSSTDAECLSLGNLHLLWVVPKFNLLSNFYVLNSRRLDFFLYRWLV